MKTNVRVFLLICGFRILGNALMAVWGVLPQVGHKQDILLVLFSVIVLREVYVCFFLLVALHGVVGWVKTDKLNFLILASVGFLGATFFHGGMIVGLIVFGIIVSLSYLKKLFRLLINSRINLKFVLFLVNLSATWIFFKSF